MPPLRMNENRLPTSFGGIESHSAMTYLSGTNRNGTPEGAFPICAAAKTRALKTRHDWAGFKGKRQGRIHLEKRMNCA
jgi:hypothetical protein